MKEESTNIIEETQQFGFRCFFVILYTIFFFIAYKIISNRLDIIINYCNIESFFIKIFGEVNVFNTILVMIFIYLTYYISKKILLPFLGKDFEIKNIIDFIKNAF